jgi:hypothetical protein
LKFDAQLEEARPLTLDELAFGPEGARIRGEITVPVNGKAYLSTPPTVGAPS